MKKRKIEATIEFDPETWDGYEDVCDELMLEDSGIFSGLKRGVAIKLKNEKNETSTKRRHVEKNECIYFDETDAKHAIDKDGYCIICGKFMGRDVDEDEKDNA